MAKDVIGIDGKTVCTRLDSRNRRSTTLIQISPILVGLGIKDVILEINAALCENGNGILGSLGKIDLDLKLSTALGRNVVRDMLGDGIVKVGVPFGISILSGISLSFEDISLLREFVEVEVLLKDVSQRIIDIVWGIFTGPKVRSKPLVMLGWNS